MRDQGLVRRASAVLVVLAALGAWSCGSSAPAIVAGPMPEGGSFHGVYFSPQYGEMNLVQNGSAVVGEYKQEMRSGRIQGEAKGDLLKFEWTEKKSLVSNRAQESRGHGYFRYLIDKANGDHVIKGEWGLGDSETGSPWNAFKSKGKEPKLSTQSSGGESSDSSEESEGSESSDKEESSDDLF